jgi:hypothetical protein
MTSQNVKGDQYMTSQTVEGFQNMLFQNVDGDQDMYSQTVKGDQNMSFQNVDGDQDMTFQNVGGHIHIKEMIQGDKEAQKMLDEFYKTEQDEYTIGTYTRWLMKKVSNYPPGVTTSMIPGHRPIDEAWYRYVNSMAYEEDMKEIVQKAIDEDVFRVIEKIPELDEYIAIRNGGAYNKDFNNVDNFLDNKDTMIEIATDWLAEYDDITSYDEMFSNEIQKKFAKHLWGGIKNGNL